MDWRSRLYEAVVLTGIAALPVVLITIGSKHQADSNDHAETDDDRRMLLAIQRAQEAEEARRAAWQKAWEEQQLRLEKATKTPEQQIKEFEERIRRETN